ncbi:DUF4296 domain-containing protein [Viscerimonas tarda]
MSKSKMEQALYDLQLSQSAYEAHVANLYLEEQQRALVNSVLKKYDITQQILDSSLVWYTIHDTELLLKMNDSVAARLRREQAVLDKINRAEIAQDEARKKRKLLASYIYLSPQEPTYFFSLDSVNLQNIELAALKIISLKMLGMSPSMDVFAYAKFEYADTSVVKPFAVEKDLFWVIAPTLPDKTPKNISGYAHVQSKLSHFDVLIYDIRFRCENDSID